jgi:hypothetical protein
MASKQVTKPAEAPPPADTSYEDRYSDQQSFAGGEFSVTPQVKILHGQSPECLRNNAAYVEGSGPGMILLTNSQRLISPDDGILFQPCFFTSPWQLRMAKQAGQGARYLGEFPDPQQGWEKKRAREGYDFFVDAEKNEARQVLKFGGFVYLDDEAAMPYIITFAGTGIFVARKWNGQINAQRTSSGKRAASYNNLYSMKVKTRSNAAGEWGQWNINFARKANESEMEMGHALYEEFRTEARRMEGEAEDFSGGGGSHAPAEGSEANPL